MRNYFLKLFKYNYWANDLLVNKLEELAINDPEIEKIFSHVVSAQFIWFSRISGQTKYHREVWGYYNLSDLPAVSKESSELYLGYLSEVSSEEFEREIKFITSKGDAFTQSISDTLVHVINHGNYHRGQIAKLLRQKNIDPPITDYIIYLRTIKP